jgi:uncharacterized membrane protein
MIPTRLIYGIKTNLRIMLSIGMVIIGVMHFVSPEPFVAIVPNGLPHPLAFVYGSGLIEVIAGAGLFFPAVSQISAWTLILLYVCVFPANWYQAVHNISVAGLPHDPPLIWLRIPMQALLIAWAYWLTRDERRTQGGRQNRGYPQPSSS